MRKTMRLGCYVVLAAAFLQSSLCYLTEEEILRRVETNVNSQPVNNTRLTQHLIQRYQLSHRLQCSQLCFLTKGCQSYNYYEEEGICELNDQTYLQGLVDFSFQTGLDPGWEYHDRYSFNMIRAWWHECSEQNPCENGAVCTRKVLKSSGVERPPCAPLCVCPVGYSGRHCETCDWHQVFATVNGTGQKVFDAWNASLHDEVLHQKSFLIEEWKTLGIKKVKVVLETSGEEDVELIFNGENTDKFDWFSQARLLSSPWSDLPGEMTNFFSIEGHPIVLRRFFISKSYNSCPGDTGWMVVVENGTDVDCEWERVPTEDLPGILYSGASTCISWGDEDLLRRADRMVIYIQMCQ